MTVTAKIDLSKKSCKPCEGAIQPMAKSDAEYMLKNISGWELDLTGNCITKTFKFSDFYRTMSFVNAIAWVAGNENHHPDLEVSYNRCKVNLSTHSINGLSENDFIMASKIDKLLE